MRTILKNCLLTLPAIIMQSQAANADSTQHADELLFSPTETALSEELDNARGREGMDILVVNNVNVRATVSGNVANNNVNGFNVIDHGSFTQASGITSVIQNSGNNVIIQDSTIVNVTIWSQ